MKIKALITTLAILGSASAAMARPVITASVEANWSYRSPRTAPVVVRDHRQTTYVDTREPMLFPNNTIMMEDASAYKGPLPIVNKRTQFRSSYEYGYYNQSWLAITAPTRIDRGREYISDLPDLGRFSRIRLQSNAGTTHITQVLVRFKDGGEQLVKLDATLNRWNPVIEFDLDGRSRKIHGFVVYGTSGHGSAYQVLAL
jgi:hypothetical protein